MKKTERKQQFPIVWATNPDAGTYRQIPQQDPENGGASLTKGWSKINSTPLPAGGKPPSIEDENGILKMLSTSAQNNDMGFFPAWSADFAQAIGGYPQTAKVVVINNGIPDMLISISDNNLDNPADPKQLNWISIKENLALKSELEGYQPKGDYLLEKYFPVGMPCPWPLAQPPDGWLIMQGQNFDKTAYPQLATAYPQGALPDMRGNYISGFDPTGINDDKGRALLSWQGDAMQEFNGYLSNICRRGGVGSGGPFSWHDQYTQNFHVADSGAEGVGDIRFDNARSVRVANKNRPSNWAFNFIVRAK